MACSGDAIMSNPPAWLPPILNLPTVWGELYPLLYGIFERDIKSGATTFQGLPLWWNHKVLPGNTYEEGFYHLISIDSNDVGDRVPDFRRAERLPWCSPSIINCSNIEIKLFDYTEGSDAIRTYIWLENFDYCVVLEKIKRKEQLKAALLVTAFYVDGDSRRKNLRRKFEQRV
jgi:hypothetical protein